MDEHEILDRELKVGKLQELLETMEVPENKRTDHAWLFKNLGVQNRFHKDYPEATFLLREIMRDGIIHIE